MHMQFLSVLKGNILCNGLLLPLASLSKTRRLITAVLARSEHFVMCAHNLCSPWSPAAHGDRALRICKGLARAGCGFEVV